MTRVLIRTLVAVSLVTAGCAVRPARTALVNPVRVDAPPCRSESVRWIAPADAKESARLDAWCAAVGPAIVRGARDPLEPRLDDVLFASWNVHVGAGAVERFVQDLRAGRLTDGRSASHVVLLLQEALRGGDVPESMPADARAAGRIGDADLDEAGIEQLAQRLDMSLLYVPSMRNGAASDRYPATDRGNAILSTLPLLDPSAIELPGDGQRRVAASATLTLDVDGEATPIVIGSAHLSTRGPVTSPWLLNPRGLRHRQAQALAQSLPDGPMILGADLNSWMGGPDEPAARALQRAFPETPGGRRQATAGAGMVLDYLFFRAPAQWRARLVRAPERYGSDHYPLVGWLERT